ncbi:hypothetical protein PMAYCL1PPCAC_01963 [Pristionchus mayeri]|uniref:Angiomotin C-terminal domain-containing protein n=1 Tax=Pristionchus mayeri TaxID=1317129 RepID=A0AAN4Z4I3_9BILA|nr:hypothetical protein PMAYCL1PPCAC_01963 [Pristionchus mayeri]
MGEQPGRRINTVNPIMSDQRMLQHLMQEMSVETKENELKLKAMLDKYQQEVTGVVRSSDLQPIPASSMLQVQQPPPAWAPPQGMSTSVRVENQLHAPPPMVSSMTCGGSPHAPSSSPLHSTSSHSQPCLASTAVDMKDPSNGAGSSWTSSTALENRRLAYTRGRSTEQSCLAGAGPFEATIVTSVHPGYNVPPPPPPVSSSSSMMVPPPPSAMVQPSPQYHQYVPMGASASNSLQQAVQAMRQENIFLRAEVDRLTAKANTLQRLENEHGAIEAEYDALLREKERMEEMEKHALQAYETRIKVVEQERDSLREQLQQSQHAHHLMTAAAAKIEEYNKLSAFVAALSRQKDELSMVAERQRREIGSQTTTLEEQRKHIAVLETALGKAQERVQMSDKIIEEFRSEQRMKDANSNGNGNCNGIGVVRRSSSKNSSPSTTASSEGGNNELIAMLRWQLKSRDDMILKLEATLNEYQKRVEEADRTKNAMTHTFNEKIEGLQREKYDRDRKIAELTEAKERLLAEFQLDGSDTGPNEDDSRRLRDLNRMEEVRQKIQEKKKRVNRPQTKNVRSLTSWSSTTQLTPSTSTAESLPCLSTVTYHSRPAPPPPDLTTTATVIPSVSYTYAPTQPSNNYTTAEYSNARGITTTTMITNGNTVITKEADL